LKFKLILLLIFVCALCALALKDDHSTNDSIEKITIRQTAVVTKEPNPLLLLSLDDVKKAFEYEGLILEPWSDVDFYKLNDVKASMFHIHDGRFAIYVFKTEADRKQARIDFNNQTAMSKLVLSHIFEVKNLLVFELIKPTGSGFRVNEILAGLNESPLNFIYPPIAYDDGNKHMSLES
jgi:hypothetical protein